MGWSFANILASRLGTLLIGVALARVLGPDEFGVFAIATVTMLAVLSFNELGVSLAIVRWPEDARGIAPTVNLISVASSALLTGLVVAVAPLLSTALGDVRATPVVQVMAVAILINGLVATPAAILQREFKQKERAIADQVNAWLGALVALVLALAGWGAMSLAIGRITGSLVSSVLLWRWSPIPYRFGWDRTVARKLMRFGVPLAASSIVVFGAGYADQVIVGSQLGALALGFYVLAFNLASWPLSIFSQPLRQVAPAVFSKLQQDNEGMVRNFTRTLAMLSAVAIPACLAISGAAEPVIEFIYGAKWRPAADVLVYLAILAAIRIWIELVYDYLVVLGKSMAVLMTQLLWFVAAVPAMLWLVDARGAEGAALGQLLVAGFVVLPTYLLILRTVGLQTSSLARAVWLPVVAGLLLWFACWLLSASSLWPAAASALAGVLALLTIGGLLYARRDDLQRLRTALRRTEP